jgi:hypothetical protein
MTNLLLIHDLMKIGLVIGIVVLVVTCTGHSSAAGAVVQQSGLLIAGPIGTPTASRYVRTAEGATDHDFDDDSFAQTGTAIEHISLLAPDEPDTDSPWPDPVSCAHEDRWIDLDSDKFEPLFNIDGTMMLGDFDLNGNMHGVTDSHFDSWDSTTASSMWDD